LSDFELNDEIYWGFRTSADVTPLITTTHPKSGKPLAWARTEGRSRVAYIQLGHGPNAFKNENFRKLVGNAIGWAGKRN
jgi:type 1 glutamine amidotransferase